MPCIVYSGFGWGGGVGGERERDLRTPNFIIPAGGGGGGESSELYYSRTEILGNSLFLQTCPWG